MDPKIPTQRPSTPDSTTQAANGCQGPGYPHNPPHCGCPAG
ncbi:hypothetical protein SEA_YDN12_35 [Streptomyces phage YDN12]|uniref:Uncharacterized protein n=1 Tax=Streptomyces phage YDN12 TaxID=1636183 RepID=A0A0E3JQE5_9CAUD|nr:hypothetical protein AVT63_gp34 [Streptomyces phage YDN12]AKA61702.1 hypothetical protein SEA_YDN12_35 [Streptomyces phage YDN12]